MKKFNLLVISCLFLITIPACEPREQENLKEIDITIDTISQIEPVIYNVVLNEMGQAYGFSISQDYLLELIKTKYPRLEPQIEIAKLKFKRSFGKSLSTIDSILSYKSMEWPEIKSSMNDQIKLSVKISDYDYDRLNDIVLLVEKRAAGEIPAPIIGTLLTFNPKYLKNPTLEFTDGFKSRFSSKDNEKAKGVDFHLDLPQSWLSKEGNRPNIVQKFISQNGHGLAMALVLVLELPEVSNISEEDIKELAQSDESKEMLPKNSQFINSGFIKIDGLPGIYQEYKLSQMQLDTELLLHTAAYNVYYKNYMIRIECSVGSNKDQEKDTDSVFMKYKELFKLVAGSLVVQSQWK